MAQASEVQALLLQPCAGWAAAARVRGETWRSRCLGGAARQHATGCPRMAQQHTHEGCGRYSSICIHACLLLLLCQQLACCHGNHACRWWQQRKVAPPVAAAVVVNTFCFASKRSISRPCCSHHHHLLHVKRTQFGLADWPCRLLRTSLTQTLRQRIRHQELQRALVAKSITLAACNGAQGFEVAGAKAVLFAPDCRYLRNFCNAVTKPGPTAVVLRKLDIWA